MIRRDRPRGHAAPTARARRVRAAADRDEQLRAQGIDPADYERTVASSWGPPRVEKSKDGPPARPPAKTGEASTPRRPLRIKRVLITALVLVLVIVVTGSILLYQRVDAFNKAVSSAPTLGSALFGPLGGKDRVNVLMIGYSGDPKHGGTYLADSLNILSIDPVANATTLIPIPRDLWVQGIKELPRGGKINEAFAVGWDVGGWKEAGRAQTEVVSQVTGLTIDHWISLDFAGLSGVVDAVGGVTVDNPRTFAYTFWEGNYLRKSWSATFHKGTLQLTGAQALTYARVRYTSVQAEASDFARSVRQQRVISALRVKMGTGGLGSLGPGLAMMDALKGHLRTDLSAIDLFLLSGHLHTDRRLELKEGVVLQAGRNNAGQYILFPVGAKKLGDYAPLKRFLATEMAKPIPTPKPSPSATAAR
jgi:LCP family protein required for cell wall assembly